MAFRWSRVAAGSVRRLAAGACVSASLAHGLQLSRELRLETRQDLEERVRMLETKIKAMELNDLEEVRDFALVLALGWFYHVLHAFVTC